MVLLEAFERPDGVVRFDGVVRNFKRSVDSYLRPKDSVVLVLQIILNIINTVCIDHGVDEIVG